MPLIEVDPDGLALTRVRLSDAVAVAHDVQSHRSRLTAPVGQCGDRVLHDAACSFVARWSYCAGLIADEASCWARCWPGPVRTMRRSTAPS